MKYLGIPLCLLFQFGIAQIDENSLLNLPIASATEINAISTSAIKEGALIFNSDDKEIYQFDSSQWVPVSKHLSSTIILNREESTSNTLLSNATNTYYDLPINASHIQSNTGSTYAVVGNGKIQVNTAGTYMISASLSTSNMPAGTTKYILAAFVNNTLVGYLTRGFVSLPGTDWWGGSGVLMYSLQSNDVISIRYVLNNGGVPLSARYLNIGVTRV
ncbi:hypothetical protein ACFSTE_16025 [Aquimarina hainanensis]|uniref:C1q domain-containing protein n=1 Tax=Aquimarina hainanensis TaxID=1578017 RepID=A0ABW5NBB8_9FLAO|nr:hypothetical protein [Aquimarina sp. TRL1]QKX07141.1 hypothetical protein HN014_20215 [Aquimarina sp. TRL1]